MTNARRSRRDILEEQLTTQQIRAVHLILNAEINPKEAEHKTQDEIADAVGVSRMSLYRWRTNNRAFIEYKKEVARDYLSDEVGLFANALIRSMKGTNGTPSMKALDLFAKMMGFIQTTSQVDINVGGERSNDDILAELTSLQSQVKEIESVEVSEEE